MSNIRISPDTMRQRASQYRTEAENVGQVISKMDSLLNALQSEWEGESSRAFADRFTQLRPTFVNGQNLINEIATALDNQATVMEDTDRQGAASMRG